MREKTTGEYSYSDFDSGYLSGGNRRFTFGRNNLSNARRMREHFGERVDHFGERINNLGARVTHVGNHFGNSGGFMKLHDRIWSKLTFFTGVGFIGLVAWLLAKLLKFAVPAKWTFLSGLLSVIETVGWWALVICAGILILGWIIGAFCRFQEWLKGHG